MKFFWEERVNLKYKLIVGLMTSFIAINNISLLSFNKINLQDKLDVFNQANYKIVEAKSIIHKLDNNIYKLLDVIHKLQNNNEILKNKNEALENQLENPSIKNFEPIINNKSLGQGITQSMQKLATAGGRPVNSNSYYVSAINRMYTVKVASIFNDFYKAVANEKSLYINSSNNIYNIQKDIYYSGMVISSAILGKLKQGIYSLTEYSQIALNNANSNGAFNKPLPQKISNELNNINFSPKLQNLISKFFKAYYDNMKINGIQGSASGEKQMESLMVQYLQSKYMLTYYEYMKTTDEYIHNKSTIDNGISTFKDSLIYSQSQLTTKLNNYIDSE